MVQFGGECPSESSFISSVIPVIGKGGTGIIIIRSTSVYGVFYYIIIETKLVKRSQNEAMTFESSRLSRASQIQRFLGSAKT